MNLSSVRPGGLAGNVEFNDGRHLPSFAGE
jgi:hypothetical protein